MFINVEDPMIVKVISWVERRSDYPTFYVSVDDDNVSKDDCIFKSESKN